ncbi:aminotransferase class I/II-fold pyridoxal phosphate-dependent enzyme [Patescibacteria group bacterium]|nr:aminotransferase class I/II-fold pyridoxal phosphate-dependent enzyme [Patescibacteria group bacterium]
MKLQSKNFARIGTENAFAIGPEIMAWEKTGYDIVRVNIGEPGCNISEAASKAMIESVKNHETHYSASAGIDSLREKVAEYLTATRKVKFVAQDVVMAPGGKPVIGGTMFILVNPGDEVVYPTPGYPIYESMANFTGAKARPILLKEANGFKFDINDLKKLVNKKTKLLILNSPSNPTGGVLEKKDMEEIAKLAKKFDFYVLADEIYSRIAFGDKMRLASYKGNKFKVTESIVSQPGMAQRTVILDGFSKTYAMTGLRLGYAASKIPGFTAKFLTFAINFWSNLPVPCMRAAEAALDKDQSEAQREIKLYQQKRDVIVKALNEIEGLKCHNPIGSFYLFVNVTKACKKLKLKDSEAMRKYLLTYDKKGKRGVAVLARQHFGKKLPEEKEEYIRISIAGSLPSLKEAVKRIKEAVMC